MISIVSFAILAWCGLIYWIHLKVKEPLPSLPLAPRSQEISVLIAFRNEGKHLAGCLQSLNASEHVNGPIPVVLVDDHSTDQSLRVIEEAASRCTNLHISVVQSTGEGKKQALASGLSSIRTEWLYLTDADCMVKPSTISSMLATAKENQAKAVFGPVLYQVTSYWDRLLAYENANTQIVSEAFVRARRAAMVNGANLLLHGDLKAEYKTSLSSPFTSGDDVFFAEALKSESFVGAYHPDSVVYTQAPEDLRALLGQRIRWASKYPGYRSQALRILPPVVALISFIFILHLFLTTGIGGNGLLFFILWLCKWIIEFSFQKHWFTRYGIRARWIDSLILSVLFPIYYVSIAVLSLTVRTFQWKGRELIR